MSYNYFHVFKMTVKCKATKVRIELNEFVQLVKLLLNILTQVNK